MRNYENKPSNFNCNTLFACTCGYSRRWSIPDALNSFTSPHVLNHTVPTDNRKNTLYSREKTHTLDMCCMACNVNHTHATFAIWVNHTIIMYSMCIYEERNTEKKKKHTQTQSTLNSPPTLGKQVSITPTDRTRFSIHRVEYNLNSKCAMRPLDNWVFNQNSVFNHKHAARKLLD